MKIVFATGIFPPDLGGPALYSRKLAEEFSREGSEVAVLTYGKNFSPDFRYSIFGVSRLWPFGIRQVIYFLKLLRISRDSDVILAFDTLGAGLPAVLSGRILKKRSVIRLGGDFIWEKYIESGRGALSLEDFYRKKIFKDFQVLFSLTRFVLRGADNLIFTTEFQKDIFSENYGLDLRKSEVISNVFRKEPGGISEVYGNKRVVLWAGRFIKLKNIDFLVKVFSRLVQGRKDLVLRLVGDGPERNSIAELVKKSDFSSSVEISRSISEDALAEEIKKSYFCALPSLSEVSPNFALKCLSLSKPVVVTSETGIRKDFPGLMYADPKNPESFYQMMLRLLDHNTYENYQKYIANIRYSRDWDDVAREYLKILKS